MTWTPRAGWLFCPADRPDRYVKALARSDVVVLDLEDAVASRCKRTARDDVLSLVKQGVYDAHRTVLRIHGAGASEHAEDLALLEQTGIHRVMLAKAEGPNDLEHLTEHDVVALIETPLGVDQCEAIANSRSVIGLMWGADDLVAALGGLASRRADGGYRDFARYARSRILVAAKARHLLALDAVYMDIHDHEGLLTECEDAAAVGFDATVAIHPSQIDVIRAAYSPTTEQIDWATRLLAEVGDNRGVTTFEGRMVDGPIYTQAQRILVRAGSTTTAKDNS
jgi:citrate lyase subunit beta / citryl-CoA lyase